MPGHHHTCVNSYSLPVLSTSAATAPVFTLDQVSTHVTKKLWWNSNELLLIVHQWLIKSQIFYDTIKHCFWLYQYLKDHKLCPKGIFTPKNYLVLRLIRGMILAFVERERPTTRPLAREVFKPAQSCILYTVLV